MKVRSLVSELDVDEGQIYEVADHVNGRSDGVYVIDDVGYAYLLLNDEYEIVEE